MSAHDADDSYCDQFTRSLLNPELKIPETLKATSKGTAPVRRFNVYKNNVVVSLIEAITSSYPVVTRLVGDEFMNAVASDYIRSGNLPVSPVLFEYGLNFADFLDNYAPLKDLPYIADVARIEAAWLVSYHAGDKVPASSGLLATIDANQADKYRVVIHPSVNLVSTNYPVFAIWHTNHNDEEVASVDVAGAGTEHILIARPYLNVNVDVIDEPTAIILRQFIDQKPLGEAVSVVSRKFADFEWDQSLSPCLTSCLTSCLASCLASLFARGVIVDIALR